MTSDELHRVKRKILAQHQPLPAGELAEFLVDLHRSLQHSPKLTLLFARQTVEPERLLDAHCKPATDTLTIAEVSAELETSPARIAGCSSGAGTSWRSGSSGSRRRSAGSRMS